MREITVDEYKKLWKDNPDMKVLSSFTDTEGIIPFGYGYPAMDTTWGYEDQPILRVESKKDYVDAKWEHKYYAL